MPILLAHSPEAAAPVTPEAFGSLPAYPMISLSINGAQLTELNPGFKLEKSYSMGVLDGLQKALRAVLSLSVSLQVSDAEHATLQTSLTTIENTGTNANYSVITENENVSPDNPWASLGIRNESIVLVTGQLIYADAEEAAQIRREFFSLPRNTPKYPWEEKFVVGKQFFC